MKLNLLLCGVVLVACRLLPAQHSAPIPTPLATLLIEAQARNSQVAVADDAWKLSTHAALQAATLADPQLTFQSFSVGSPKPFAGFSNSEFAYVSLGASQGLPYPGKLKLRG